MKVERIMRRKTAGVFSIFGLTMVLIGTVALFPALNDPIEPAKVGIFYYLWYGAPDSDSWNASKFVDFPVLGNYSSADTRVISQHLQHMEDLGVDFVVLSWWGSQNAYGNFIDGAIKEVFRLRSKKTVA